MSGLYDASDMDMKAEIKRRLRKRNVVGLSDFVREAIFADVLGGINVSLIQDYDPKSNGHSDTRIQAVYVGTTFAKGSDTVHMKYKLQCTMLGRGISHADLRSTKVVVSDRDLGKVCRSGLTRSRRSGSKRQKSGMQSSSKRKRSSKSKPSKRN